MYELNPETAIDIGSAEGFFVFKTAEETQALVLGVDADVRRLFYATHQQIFGKEVRNVAFMRSDISFDYLERLPSQDVVYCLSVVHHIMYEHGYDYALGFVKRIKNITNKELSFLRWGIVMRRL